MSKYTRPKRDVQNFNADNFEPEKIESASDVLKITKNEIQSKMGFYTIPEFSYNSGPISNFVSNHAYSNTIDSSDMSILVSGRYHIRFMMNLRSRINEGIKLTCSNSTLEQRTTIKSGEISQFVWEGVAYLSAGDKLEFNLFNVIGSEPLVVSGNDLVILNSILNTQLISTGVV